MPEKEIVDIAVRSLGLLDVSNFNADVSKEFWKDASSAADIYLEYFPDFVNLSSRKPFTPSDFPSVSRDFSFIVDKSVSAQDLILPIKKSNIAAIKEILIFDVFKHESIDKDKKSIAITVILEPSDKTFTDSEIEKICKKIIKIANYSSGAGLRN